MTNMNTTPTPDQTPERHDCGNTIRITQYPIYKDGTHEVVSCGCGQVISDALYETDPYVRAKKRQEKIDQMEQELTTLRARLAEAEKERDEWKEQAESVPYNTLANINDTCRTRGFMEGPSGRATEDRVIALAQAYDTLRATNATLTERVRRLEEALTALSKSANAAAEWCNTSMMDDEIMHAQLILVPTPGAAVGKEGE